MDENTLLTITTFATAFLTIGLGLLVLLNNYRKYRNVSFFIFTASLAFWNITVLMQKITQDVVWGRMIFVPIPFLTMSLLLFSNHFPRSKKDFLPNTALLILFFVVLPMLLLIGTSPLIIKDVVVENNELMPIYGPLIVPYYATSGLIAIFAVVNLIRGYLKSSPEGKLRMQYLVVGLFLMFVTMTIASLIIPILVDSYQSAFYAPSSSILLVLFSSISIVRYKLWGLRYIFGKMLYYSLISVLGVIIFNAIAILYLMLWGEVVSTKAIFLGFIITLMLGPIFINTTTKIGSILKSRLMYSRYDPIKLSNRLIREISTEVDFDQLVESLFNMLQAAFDVKIVGIVTLGVDGEEFRHIKLRGDQSDYPTSSVDLYDMVKSWLQIIEQDRRFINYRDRMLYAKSNEASLENRKPIRKIQSLMHKYDINMLVPLNRTMNIRGGILIGNKHNDQIFTQEEIDILEVLRTNLSVGILRASLFKEIQDFNATLQQKVHEATEDLRDKINALEEARRRERDMLDILGHELRTPLSIIKAGLGMLEILFKKDIAGKVKDEQKKKIEEYLDRIADNLEREIELIDTLLDTTKLDQGRFTLVKDAVDVVKVIETSILSQKKLAELKDIQIVFERPKRPDDFPKIYADRLKIQEVADNLVNNAVKYTDEGKVSIGVEYDDNYVTVHVKDTGVGIPKAAQKNLGKKFYRVTQYSQGMDKKNRLVRPGGTGLGLYVTFGIVQKHKGKIWFESEEGRGSTFHFSIPRYTGQEREDQPDGEKVRDLFKRMGYKN